MYYKRAATFLFSVAVISLSACQSDRIGVSANTVAAPLSCRVAAIKEDMFARPTEGVLVAAHRGFHTYVPENSMASTQSAIDAGIDIVEMDVRVTKDGVAILMHDDTVDRTTDVTGSVEQLLWADLQNAPLKSPDGRPSTQTVPLFKDALKAAKGQIWVQIDLKSTDFARILPIVAELEMFDQVSFFHSNPAVLKSLLQLQPNAIVMPIARTPEEAIALAKDPAFQAVHLTKESADLKIAKLLDQHQKPSWLNSLGSIDEEASRQGIETVFGPFLSVAPDIVQTDLPKDLKDYLVSNQMHWSVKRPCQ